MDRNDEPQMTVEQAREQLVRAEAPGLDNRHDRWVHGLATAGFGILVGAQVVVGRLWEDALPWPFMTIGYIALLCALAWWQTRAARTVPHRARRIGYYGIGATVVLLILSMGTLNAIHAPQTPPTVLVLGVGLLVALPMLLAGHVIARGQR